MEYTDTRPGRVLLPNGTGDCFEANRAAATPSAEFLEIEGEVVALFEQLRNPVLRYALSTGLVLHDAEEVVQEAFIALFRHLQLGRPRTNLRGWIFRVTRNLALKRREAKHEWQVRMVLDEGLIERRSDPSPSPEDHVLLDQRQRGLLAVVHALPETDQSCLRLRAEGLRYREIAAALGISLGAVSVSLTRSFARLLRADAR